MGGLERRGGWIAEETWWTGEGKMSLQRKHDKLERGGENELERNHGKLEREEMSWRGTMVNWRGGK